ncbi:Imm26 family immunity protein [Methylobacterium sp. Leaf87]|uniref:Imm26 family immunity protein n=1 Tax=Methylobacterium sp. Leaf87 TaxID=1736243 RepID=UPI0009E81015|nr:Imm26 family immunity protein [Methylobacterium sp. Leaf87]
MSKKLQTGNVFSLPLCANPCVFGFGVVIRSNPGGTCFSDIYQYTNNRGGFSESLVQSDFAITELIMNDAGIRENRWKIVRADIWPNRMIEKRYYLIGFGSDVRVFDANLEEPERSADAEELHRLPKLTMPFPQYTESYIRKYLRINCNEF